MATNAPLLTIVHISDLHFGEIDPTTGDAVVSTAASKLYAQVTWFDGLLGHHARALQELEDFCSNLKQRNEPFLLFVTGDLTRCGNPSEYAVARDFLAGHVDLNPPSGNYAGLNNRAWLDFAIPGNHDHWSGNPQPFGGPNPALYTYFPRANLPYLREFQLSNGRWIQIAAINTDADVGPHSGQRFRAVGSFQNQLAALTTSQHDHVPYAWRGLLGNFPSRNWPMNSLLLHRIYGDPGQTVWAVETFLRTKQYGFQSLGAPGMRSIQV